MFDPWFTLQAPPLAPYGVQTYIQGESLGMYLSNGVEFYPKI